MYEPERIWSSTQLPSLPTAAVELLEASKNSRAEINDVIRIIKTDPALTARILRATNSSFFALRTEITAIERAIPLLGASFATALALGFSLIDEDLMTGQAGEHFRRYWIQSMVQASVAELLSDVTRTGCKDECFQAGLLLDIGQLAMMKAMGGDYLPVLASSQSKQLEVVEAENQCLGFDHSLIGQKLAENWKLAPRLQFLIEHHHKSLPELVEFEHKAESDMLRIVATASSVGDYFCRSYKGLAWERLTSLTESFFQFDEPRLHEMLESARKRFEACAEMFNLSASLPPTSELMAEANAQLSDLTVKIQMENAFVVQRQRQLEDDRKALESQNQQLQKQVFRDPLTKVYNRQFFEETLNNELQRCVRTASTFGLIFCDVDHFKRLNDTFGHLFGDEVLQMVANTIQRTIRNCDTLARFGGEEFVVLVSQATEDGIGRVAERIRREIQNQVFDFNGQQVEVTMSLGGVISVPSKSESNPAEVFLQIADEQMYQAKRSGRNRVCIKSLLNNDQRRLLDRQSEYLFGKWLVKAGAVDEATLAQTALAHSGNPARLGEMAVSEGFMLDEDIDEILLEQGSTNERFGTVAIRLGKLSEDQVAYLLARQRQDPATAAAALVEERVLSESRARELLEEFNTRCVPPTGPCEKTACIA